MDKHRIIMINCPLSGLQRLAAAIQDTLKASGISANVIVVDDGPSVPRPTFDLTSLAHLVLPLKIDKRYDGAVYLSNGTERRVVTKGGGQWAKRGKQWEWK